MHQSLSYALLGAISLVAYALTFRLPRSRKVLAVRRLWYQFEFKYPYAFRKSGIGGKMVQRIVVIAALAIGVNAFAYASVTDSKSVEAAAHSTYVSAINSNDTEILMADLTDDIIYHAPNEPEIFGKDAVRK